MRASKPIYAAFLILAAVLFAGTSSLMFMGCQGDEGPEGPSGTADCFSCHTDQDTELIVAREQQYANSRHGIGETVFENSASCSFCHTSEGFLSNLETGTKIVPENPSKIGCFTCHAPHTNKNFTLRTTAPVTFTYLGATYDYGMSNICANCHQARVPNPTISTAPATTIIKSTRWGPHHGVQGDMIAGAAGYQFADFTYHNSPHRAVLHDADGCVACHMAAPVGDSAGGHSMSMVDAEAADFVTGCNVADCHDGGIEQFDFFVEDFDQDGDNEGVQTELAGLFDQLQAQLLALGYITADGNVNASSDTPLELTADEAGALFNYQYVKEDRSWGIHNTRYAVDLLNSALAHLPAPPAMTAKQTH